MLRRIHLVPLLRLVMIGILAVGCVADAQARTIAAIDPADSFVCEIMDMSAVTGEVGDDEALP